MIVVWTTESRLNQIVCTAAAEGLRKAGIECKVQDVNTYDGISVPSLSYGVLRGTGKIYQDCRRAGIDWWNIDKGFFGAKHTDGYYRLGFRHLQPRFNPCLVPHVDSSRWEKFCISIKSWKCSSLNGAILVCPPEGICEFYGIDQGQWIQGTLRLLSREFQNRVELRFRDSSESLSAAFQRSACVITHSSNVALEALVEGIPAVVETGFVRSWNRIALSQADLSQDHLNREHLFYQAAWKQFTLQEFAEGLPWKGIEA